MSASHAPPLQGLARVACALAALLLAGIAPAMAVANKSAPLMLALAALAAVVAVIGSGQWRAARTDAVMGLRSFAMVMGLAFTAWCLASLGWSVDRAQSLRTMGELVVPITAGLVLLVTFPRVAPRWTARALAIGIGLAAVLILIELHFDMPLRQITGARRFTFELNRPTLTILLLLWPLLAASMATNRPRAALASLAVIACLALSDSTTALLGGVVGALALGVGLLAPKVIQYFIYAGMLVWITFSDNQAGVVRMLMPAAMTQKLSDAHAGDRLEIWSSFFEVREARPWLGAGFGVSPTIHTTVIADEIPVAARRLLGVGHPHSHPVQIRVETGLVGLALSMFFVFAPNFRGDTSKNGIHAPRIALLACALAIGLVGHGAWQAWWIAVLFAAGVLMRTLAPLPPDVPAQASTHPPTPAPERS